MNWDAIGAIAESLGAIAVFATLIYLALQIRQNTNSVTTATYDSVTAGFNDLDVAVLTTPELLSIFLRGSDAPASLSEIEGSQYVLMLRCYANEWHKLLRLHQHGVLSDTEWKRYAREAAQMLGTPGGRLFQSGNVGFEELYRALKEFDGAQVSEFRLEVARGGA